MPSVTPEPQRADLDQRHHPFGAAGAAVRAVGIFAATAVKVCLLGKDADL